MISANRFCIRLELFMVIFGVAIAGTSTARADIIFSNPPLNNAGSGISDLGFGQQEADDFVLAGPIATIARLRWWGSYGTSPDPAPTDDFRVRFFNDAGGSPSTTFFAEINLTGVTRTATSLTSSPFGSHDGGTVYQYEADLVPPLSLVPGTTYYLSILNNTGSAWGWLENDSVGGGGSHWFRSSDGSPWSLSVRGTDFSFELESAAAAVPEPASWALMGLGLLCLVGSGRIRQPGQGSR